MSYEEVPFQDFLDGKARYTHPDQAEYANLVRRHISAGRLMSRVHIVNEPLSDYVRFEILWPYADSVEAGEDVRLLAFTGNRWPSDLPKEDFWLFDSELVAVMRYDEEGRFLEAELVTDSGSILQYVRWRDIALETSIPYGKYVERLA